jgi:hypothetical protein
MMTEYHAAPGPYETESQAEGAVQHILASERESWTDGNHRLLEDTCRAAGVELGAYDHQALMLLAAASPRWCAVVAGIITRAAEHRDRYTDAANIPPMGVGMNSGPMNWPEGWGQKK